MAIELCDGRPSYVSCAASAPSLRALAHVDLTGLQFAEERGAGHPPPGDTPHPLRSAGFNNIDLAAADEFGLLVARVPAYSPHAGAEHTALQGFFTEAAVRAIATTTLANITAFERGEALVNRVTADRLARR